MARLEFTPSGPWKFFNYALLQTNGLAQFFDLLRYDSAFIFRRTDLLAIIQSANDQLDFVLKPFTIMLCKYDHSGAKTPSWWLPRLMSHQKLDTLTNMAQIYDLSRDHASAFEPTFKIGKTCKWIADTEIEGNLSQVLECMFVNRAFPAMESMSRVLEDALHNPTRVFKIGIATMMPTNKTPFIALPNKE